MHKNILDQIPFYISGKLTSEEQVFFERHISNCSDCKKELEEWEQIANNLKNNLSKHLSTLPPLSPIILSSKKNTSSFPQALQFMANLVWSQKIFLSRSGVLPAVAIVILLTALSPFALPSLVNNLALPMFIIVPITATIIVAYFGVLDNNPAWEITNASPTFRGILVFARLTFVLGYLTLITTLSSMFLTYLFQGIPHYIIGVWLGPMLLISALTTTLAMIWSPTTAASIALSLWTIISYFISLELSTNNGISQSPLSLKPLIEPNINLLITQFSMAVFLWMVSWFILKKEYFLMNGKGFAK